VGPYFQYGEFAFKACAENGTHYFDVTGEVPWVKRMIERYEKTAQESGAMMFPEIGIESAPPDLLTWSLAKTLREKLSAKTGDVNVSIHKLEYVPSLPTKKHPSDFPAPHLLEARWQPPWACSVLTLCERSTHLTSHMRCPRFPTPKRCQQSPCCTAFSASAASQGWVP
jgi:hypothetical protein